ncbi:hypothetical protein VSH64_47795 [Amycolatopsis rhabdoformis]|uniref:DUF4259 domain-containing protein n=1 Tax=Amycolatopsis rhabdoformis TaxID=1448059 RepID=A0ABZ1I8Q8_9PSEU|nr:hypothetical protein [Amycolatopsis rhabdoformis]WSE30411.1 hypothetical protein VSH64_47795 [Amycolatopsis rhabdoformis]
MYDWPAPDSGEVPAPELVAAWAALGTAAPERVPLWAAHWLVGGYDGEALVALAGLSGTDAQEVRDLLPAALAECAVATPASDAAAARVAFTALARLHADGRASERWVLDKVCRIVSVSGWDNAVLDLPLGRIVGLDDEWDEGWGRPVEQLVREIQDACTTQLAAGAEVP